VSIRVGGVLRTVTAKPGQTILEAGLEASVPMPYSCTLGGCGACKVKLTSGSTWADEPGCLSGEEQSAGYVLACISRAAGPCAVEVEK
jgi:ferredoxin